MDLSADKKYLSIFELHTKAYLVANLRSWDFSKWRAYGEDLLDGRKHMAVEYAIKFDKLVLIRCWLPWGVTAVTWDDMTEASQILSYTLRYMPAHQPGKLTVVAVPWHNRLTVLGYRAGSHTDNLLSINQYQHAAEVIKDVMCVLFFSNCNLNHKLIMPIMMWEKE